MPVVKTEFGNFWFTKSEAEFMESHINPKPVTVGSKTYPAEVSFTKDGLRKFVSRVLHERQFPKIKTVSKSVSGDSEEFNEYLSTLEKVQECAKTASVDILPPAVHELKLETVTEATFQQFKNKRSELLNAVSDYKEARQTYVSYKKQVDSEPLNKEIKEVERKLKNAREEAVKNFPENFQEFSHAQFVEYAYSLLARQMIKVYEVQLARLEIAKEATPYLLRIDNVKTAYEQERDRKKAAVANKLKFFKKFQIQSGGKKTKTAGVSFGSSFALCNLAIKVTET